MSKVKLKLCKVSEYNIRILSTELRSGIENFNPSVYKSITVHYVCTVLLQVQFS